MCIQLVYKCPSDSQEHLHVFVGMKNKRQAEIRCLWCGHHYLIGRKKCLDIIKKQKGSAQ